jgi:cellulose synthase/poly-beta-1,6-N-acetylglucosamine synthase-like glycosyltransferase
MKVSIGIPAYNEEKTIRATLHDLLNQKLVNVSIGEIIVISASTDRTNEIVKGFSHLNVSLIIEPGRKGKAAAINRFIRIAKGDVCVLCNADLIMQDDVVEKLCRPFENPIVGMTGAHVIPRLNGAAFVRYLCAFRWNMSHEVSLISPVLGELVAFRKVMRSIPETAADESSIEAVVRAQGLKIVYVPDAIFYNQAPSTLKDYVKQRRRIQAGQMFLKEITGYSAASQNISLMLRACWKAKGRDWVFFLIPAVLIEIYCRLMALYDYRVKKHNPVVWEIAGTTKKSAYEDQAI